MRNSLKKRLFAHLYSILVISNYEEDKHKVPMNNPYNIQNTNICNGIFHISFFKALNKWGRTTRANGNRGETTQGEWE
jgi:hypothetical protein